jgi:uncharacterized protein YndB with AHSA1/START domain
MKELQASVTYRILRPVDDVFDAIVNPERICRYFITRSTGPLRSGTRVSWFFDDVGASAEVEVLELDPGKSIVFAWGNGPEKNQVTMEFEAVDSQTTSLHITEDGYDFTQEGVDQVLQQTQGWTDFLCSLKAYLYTGINLRNGKTVAGT